jgi:hypothetical protein
MRKFANRINRLQRASERAIAKFLSAEKKLTQHNDKLTDHISQLTDEMALIAELRDSALKRREENAGIAKRIAQIVRGDSV